MDVEVSAEYHLFGFWVCEFVKVVIFLGFCLTFFYPGEVIMVMSIVCSL